MPGLHGFLLQWKRSFNTSTVRVFNKISCSIVLLDILPTIMSASSLLAMEISISVVNALAVYKIATKKRFRELLSVEKIIRIIYRRSDKYKFY